MLDIGTTEPPKQLPSHRFQPMLPDLLELVASERPGLLAPLVAALAESPAAGIVVAAARELLDVEQAEPVAARHGAREP